MLEVKIDMCVEEGQDGQCGNFNYNVTDDSEEHLMTRMNQKILPHECLIERFPQHTKMLTTILGGASTRAAPESYEAKNASEIRIAMPVPSKRSMSRHQGARLPNAETGVRRTWMHGT